MILYFSGLSHGREDAYAGAEPVHENIGSGSEKGALDGGRGQSRVAQHSAMIASKSLSVLQLLLTAVHKYQAKDWVKIAAMVPGRNMAQCRERYEWEISTVELREICQFRWAGCLDASIVMGDWTAEEDDKLKLFIEKIGRGKC